MRATARSLVTRRNGRHRSGDHRVDRWIADLQRRLRPALDPRYRKHIADIRFVALLSARPEV